MATAAQIANRLRELSGETLTPLQLLKLVYISHGWSFPINNGPLIGDRIEAWQYGPVVPALYHTLKSFRSAPVTNPIPDGDVPLSQAEVKLVDAVYSTYGHYSGGQLSAMTHRPGTPWATAWEHGRNSEITNEMIADHYRKLAVERRRAT
jgi:uncharacterized phage-associated protein